MPRINVNPEAEVGGFAAVKAMVYPMRIKEVKDRRPEKEDLQVTLEHVTPTVELVGLDEEPLKGNPSGVFDYVQLAPDKQWKLRGLVEACGLEWSDFDTEDLPGKELQVGLKVEEYQGEFRNKVGRYVVEK